VTLRLVQVATDDQLAFALAHALALDLRRPGGSTARPILSHATWLAVELTERAGFTTDDSEVAPAAGRRAALDGDEHGASAVDR
jgi:hypothetical protein